MIKRFHKALYLLVIAAISVTCLTACEKESSEEEVNTETLDTSFTEVIEETVLVDENGIKVVLQELFDDETYGKGMTLYLENNTIQTLLFDCKKLIINDHMINLTNGEMLQPGTNATLTCYFSSDILSYLGIGKIGEIVTMFDFYDPETYDSFYKTDFISVKTSEYDNMVSEVDFEEKFDGQVVYEDSEKGLTITGTYVEDDELFSSALLLYVQNDADTEYLLKADSLIINGTEGGNMVVNNVCGGAKSLFYIEFDKSELANHGISEIEELQTDLTIIDRTLQEIVGTTGIMTVTTDK